MADENIFSGLKVVDLASFIAGPGAATMIGRPASPHLSAPATAAVERQLRLAPGQSQQARNVAGPEIAAREDCS